MFYFNIPLYTGAENSEVNTIINSQMSFANVAMSAMNSYVSTMVNYATQAINVPTPAAMAAGLDFDFSKEAFDDLFGRKPTMPTTNQISVNLPLPPNVDVPNIQAIILKN